MLLHVNNKEEDLQHASTHSLCFRNPTTACIKRQISWNPTKFRSLLVSSHNKFVYIQKLDNSIAGFTSICNTSTLLQLYKSFIRPHLEYCAIVWDPHLLKDVEALEKVQRFAPRMCLKNWSLDHNSCISSLICLHLSTDNLTQSSAVFIGL